MNITAEQRRELIQLLIEVDGHSKAAAKQIINGTSPEGQLAELHQLRRQKRGPAMQTALPQSREEGGKLPVSQKTETGKAKKVPYTLLMPPEQLDALKVLAERDDSSVSHHIRQAVRSYLRTRSV